MTRRNRKLFGSIALLIFVMVYALVVMTIAQGRIQDTGKFTQLIFFIIAGLGWILPVLPLIRWMERGGD